LDQEFLLLKNPDIVPIITEDGKSKFDLIQDQVLKNIILRKNIIPNLVLDLHPVLPSRFPVVDANRNLPAHHPNHPVLPKSQNANTVFSNNVGVFKIVKFAKEKN